MIYNTDSIEFQIAKRIEDGITILVEKTTDVIYLKTSYAFETYSLTPMLDPETGLPLTYKVWEAKYKNKNK